MSQHFLIICFLKKFRYPFAFVQPAVRFWSGYEVNLAVVIRFLSHEFCNFIVNVSKERRIFLNTKIVLEADQDPGGILCTFLLFYVSPLPFTSYH